MHTSVLTGAAWVGELLSGHPDRIRNNLGVRKHVFRKLCSVLQEKGVLSDSRWVSIEEQLAIFLRAGVTNDSNRRLMETFQRSGDTISRMFHSVLDALLTPQFYNAYVKLPDPRTVPPEIADFDDFYPWFKDCIGALDGTHKLALPPDHLEGRYRNRKGVHSINVLAACNFSLFFVYVLSGWEGSACDSAVFEDARSSDFPIPPGKYYLADAGYATCNALLTPYRGVRYHLKEWKNTGESLQNYKELFNLRHARLRNAIERIFGVLKRRFTMMKQVMEYDIKTQARVVPALCALHNFIRIHDPDDLEEPKEGEQDGDSDSDSDEDVGSLGRDRTTAEVRQSEQRRDEIAKAMWEDYVRRMRRQR